MQNIELFLKVTDSRLQVQQPMPTTALEWYQMRSRRKSRPEKKQQQSPFDRRNNHYFPNVFPRPVSTNFAIANRFVFINVIQLI